MNRRSKSVESSISDAANGCAGVVRGSLLLRAGLTVRALIRTSVLHAMPMLCATTPVLATDLGAPIHLAPVKPIGVEPEFQCGMFRWSTDFPWLSGGGIACWEDFNGAPCMLQFKRANLSLNCDTGPCEVVVEAIFRLSNEGGEYWTSQTSAPDPTLDPISATAQRTGWLFYEPPPVPLLAQTQRLKLRSVGTVALSIQLHREGSVAGWTDASASGAGTASIKTVGEGFGVREEYSIGEALADATENHAKAWQPGVSWATQTVSTQLGAGFSFGTENGGSANVGWSAGGHLVTQEISELMVCTGWDCVGGDAAWNKLFAQEAAVSAKAGLIDGRYARVHAKSTFKDFEMSALIGPDGFCVPCEFGDGYRNPVTQPPQP